MLCTPQTIVTTFKNRLPLWTVSLALEPADCVLCFKTKMAGNIKGWVDERMIMISSYNVSLYGLVVFSHNVTFFGQSDFWGLRYQTSPGLCPWTPLGNFRPPTLSVPLSNQNPGSAPEAYTLTKLTHFYFTSSERCKFLIFHCHDHDT